MICWFNHGEKKSKIFYKHRNSLFSTVSHTELSPFICLNTLIAMQYSSSLYLSCHSINTISEQVKILTQMFIIILSFGYLDLMKIRYQAWRAVDFGLTFPHEKKFIRKYPKNPVPMLCKKYCFQIVDHINTCNLLLWLIIKHKLKTQFQSPSTFLVKISWRNDTCFCLLTTLLVW